MFSMERSENHCYIEENAATGQECPAYRIFGAATGQECPAYRIFGVAAFIQAQETGHSATSL
jgi:hypothetical protein